MCFWCYFILCIIDAKINYKLRGHIYMAYCFISGFSFYIAWKIGLSRLHALILLHFGSYVICRIFSFFLRLYFFELYVNDIWNIVVLMKMVKYSFGLLSFIQSFGPLCFLHYCSKVVVIKTLLYIFSSQRPFIDY